MRAVLQRVSRAAVRVEGETVAAIGPGLLVLLGVAPRRRRADAPTASPRRSGRCASSPTPQGRMNERARRARDPLRQPVHALRRHPPRQPPELHRRRRAASARARSTSASASALGAQRGRFGAHMEVELVGDGPVTIVAGSNLNRDVSADRRSRRAAARAAAVGGIDLGGTKIEAIVTDSAHRVLGSARHPTPTSGGPADVANAMAAALTEAAKAANARARAAARRRRRLARHGRLRAPGTVAHADNLPGWLAQLPARRRRCTRRSAPRSCSATTSRVATNAEFELGAGKPYHSLLGVFWGTGVGGGLILDGKPWHGRGAAGEIGHMVIRAGRPALPVRAPRLPRGLRRARGDGGPRAPPARPRATRRSSSSWPPSTTATASRAGSGSARSSTATRSRRS